MNGALFCVGKLRERYLRDAADEYLKRLQRFGTFAEAEVPDLPESAHSSTALEAEIKRKEGTRLLAALRPGDYVTALCIDGTQWPSDAYAKRLETLEAQGTRRFVWIIGGSLATISRPFSIVRIMNFAAAWRE